MISKRLESITLAWTTFDSMQAIIPINDAGNVILYQNSENFLATETIHNSVRCQSWHLIDSRMPMTFLQLVDSYWLTHPAVRVFKVSIGEKSGCISAQRYFISIASI